MKRIWNKHKQTNTPLKRKVFVGLSGGVDSAVSAALLKKAGYEVTGVFIKVWQPDWIKCDWKEERREAMRVAARLRISFITLDLEKEYKEGVIDYMIAEYKVGRTPNPDVMCNREVKFGAFWRWAEYRGGDFIATGHYARISSNIQNVSHSKEYSLLAGKDPNKDQSYFLWTLNQSDLAHVLFPVGDMTKPEVRKLAARFKLPNANKKDSQGLCFIGKVDVKDFLSRYIENEPGTVLDTRGEMIGFHPGALFFTIGERHGFTITKKTSRDARYFVIGKNIEKNTITVSNKSQETSSFEGKKILKISKVNWLSGSVWNNSANEKSRGVKAKYPLKARSRYRQPLQNVKILSTNLSDLTVEFEEPQNTLTPGQSLVVYEGETCVAGGIID